MTLQQFAAWIKQRWAHAANRPNNLAIMTLGLVGEAGEVSEPIKKHIRGDGPVDIENLKLELGDVLHYWCCICNHFGIDPEAVMLANMDKLIERERAKRAREALQP
jgi:NTP pyrophosphatase (non-canonical NTP hydrolase)